MRISVRVAGKYSLAAMGSAIVSMPSAYVAVTSSCCDGDRQMQLLDELAVRDFFLQKRSAAQPHVSERRAGDEQMPLVDEDAQTFAVGAGQFNAHDQRARGFVDDDVGVGFPAARARPPDQFLKSPCSRL